MAHDEHGGEALELGDGVGTADPLPRRAAQLDGRLGQSPHGVLGRDVDALGGGVDEVQPDLVAAADDAVTSRRVACAAHGTKALPPVRRPSASAVVTGTAVVSVGPSDSAGASTTSPVTTPCSRSSCPPGRLRAPGRRPSSTSTERARRGDRPARRSAPPRRRRSRRPRPTRAGRRRADRPSPAPASAAASVGSPDCSWARRSSGRHRSPRIVAASSAMERLIFRGFEVHVRSQSQCRGTRGRPRPKRAMRSRWTSFTPPPKVRIERALDAPLDAAGEDGAGRALAQRGGGAEHLGEQLVGLGRQLGAVHLRGAGVSGVGAAGGRHLPADELEVVELGPDPGEVDLHPLLVDDPPPVGQLRVLRPAHGLLVACGSASPEARATPARSSAG